MLTPEEVIVLSREIQGMMAAGVPLDIGLKSAASGFDGDLETAAQRIAALLEQGAPLAEALEHEHAVPPLFKAVLVAGLSTGHTEEVLADVTQLTQTMVALKQAVRIGLVYPILVVFTAMTLFLGALVILFPRVSDIYQQLRIDAPYWLQFANSFEIQGYHFAILGGLLLGALYWLWSVGRSHGFRGISWIPGLQPVMSDFAIAHFANVVSLLLRYQIPLPEALQLTAQTLQPGKFRDQVLRLAQVEEHGGDLPRSLESNRTFPPFLRWLLVTGYRDSNLSSAVAQAAEFYQVRAQSRARWIGHVLPTVSVVVIGGLATLVYALTVFGPMIDLWDKMATQ